MKKMIYIFNVIFSIIYTYFFRYIKKYNFLVFFPIFFLWFLIIGFQYNVGTDYFNYLDIFYDKKVLELYYRKKEYIFYYFIVLLKKFFLNGQSLFISVSFLENLLLYFFIKKLIKENIIEKKYVFIFIFIFLCYGTNFYNQMNVLRQYFNIYLLSFCIIYVYNGEIFKYIISFVIATNIHRSFICLFPIFLIKYLVKKLNKKKFILLLLLSIIFNFLPVLGYIKKILLFFPRYSHYIYSDYFLEIPLLNKMTKFIYIPFYFLSINLLDSINSEKKQYILKVGILAFIIRIFCLKVSVLNRIGEYFTLISIFPIYYLISEYYKRKKFYVIFILVLIIIMLFIFKVLIFPKGEYLYRSYFFITKKIR